jgi:recombination protein RecR
VLNFLRKDKKLSNKEPDLIPNLITALRALPGVGQRTAERLAFYLLSRGKNCGLNLSQSLEKAIHGVTNCQRCRNLSTDKICAICQSAKRDSSLLCVIENPIDLISLENSQVYQGKYFVLHGHLSPLDGIGPMEIGVGAFDQILQVEPIKEVVLATNNTIEGEATAHYLSEIVKQRKIKCSRLAHGIPMGGELEYVDANTLSWAFQGRVEIDQ